MDRVFVMSGSAFMLLGVAAGAFGSHGLAGYFEQYPDLESTYEIAVRYMVYHALALLALAWVGSRWPGPLVNWAGILLVAGIVIFSGSLFALVVTRASWLGAITPLGGVAFIVGWALIFLAAWRN